MDDGQIVDLFWERSESALSETQKKYGRYCHAVAFRILGSREDAEECVNDAYLQAWNSIPPHKPDRLSAFLGKITRNLSLSRCEKKRSQKRGGGQAELALDELSECVTVGRDHDIADDIALRDALNGFLSTLSDETRRIFVRRYWYLCSVKEIAADMRSTESKVKMTLFRTRSKLKDYLESEGIYL